MEQWLNYIRYVNEYQHHTSIILKKYNETDEQSDFSELRRNLDQELDELDYELRGKYNIPKSKGDFFIDMD